MNKSGFRAFLTMVCLFVPEGTAGAPSIEEARTVFAEGRFMEAADLAQGIETSDGYALAARSLTIYSYYLAPDSEQANVFRRAEQLARKAIRLDASNPEAYFQLAHAMGRHAQVIGIMQATNEGYATEVHDAIQEALRLDPDMAFAHLGLAAWHAEALRAAGLFATVLYGANEEDALAHFERALELAPQEKVVLFEYALGLLSLKTDDHLGKARDLLKRMIQLPPEDARDRIIHRKAVERLAALDGGAPD